MPASTARCSISAGSRPTTSSRPTQESWLLEAYFGAAPGADLRRRYAAMKCASLLREAMWSMVSEIHLQVDFDYVAYTTENLARFERAYEAFQS